MCAFEKQKLHCSVMSYFTFFSGIVICYVMEDQTHQVKRTSIHSSTWQKTIILIQTQKQPWLPVKWYWRYYPGRHKMLKRHHLNVVMTSKRRRFNVMFLIVMIICCTMLCFLSNTRLYNTRFFISIKPISIWTLRSAHKLSIC